MRIFYAGANRHLTPKIDRGLLIDRQRLPCTPRHSRLSRSAAKTAVWRSAAEEEKEILRIPGIEIESTTCVQYAGHLPSIRSMHTKIKTAVAAACAIFVFCVVAVDCRRHHTQEVHNSHQPSGDIDKYVVVDSKTGIRYNPYSKHHPGRHVCASQKQVSQPLKRKQPYCKPVYKKYMVPCSPGSSQLCTALRVIYETHYKEITTAQTNNEVTYSCCPGWTQVSPKSHGCNRPKCSKPCQNGGKCVKPELCGCLKGFSGVQCEINHNKPECPIPCQNGGRCLKENYCSCPRGFGGNQCEIDLNKPNCSKGCHNGGTCVRHELCRCPKGFGGRHCEVDVDECKEMKPCDQICYNTFGSYNCQCREDFILLADGQSCRKEVIDTPLEANNLEFEQLDKRIIKLETMMDESHKNEVSKSDIQNIYKDINAMTKDVYTLKNKFDDMDNYRNDMHIFKNKLSEIERKADKVNNIISNFDFIPHWSH
ncbi:unnamed protein product [Brassicogethes aeneus]|uniref:Uncharacterized protein n=1 Tax=Brassicogethes aeneus TaxID=1431903 RepID=A0A9P0FAT8_BRAAE|nr:unnamed protein product [Brassicogethes aeneus]